MKFQNLVSGFASACLLTEVHARPEWLQRKHKVPRPDVHPRDYNVYYSPTTYGYTYGGYGPAPTISSSAVPTSSEATPGTTAEATLSVPSYESK